MPHFEIHAGDVEDGKGNVVGMITPAQGDN